MAKGFRIILAFLLFVFFAQIAVAQIDPEDKEKEFNQLYQPLNVVQRLSYDNFKKIKLLYASIANFGGGQAEFDKLVDMYAEASALYFQKKIIESANLFTKNEKEIDATAMRIAKQYKDETEKLHSDMIKINVKYKIKREIEKKEANAYSDKELSIASQALEKASDYYVRSRPIDAINHYRRTKESCFLLYKVLGMPVPEKFEKDIADNKNQVYVAKEKKM